MVNYTINYINIWAIIAFMPHFVFSGFLYSNQYTKLFFSPRYYALLSPLRI